MSEFILNNLFETFNWNFKVNCSENGNTIEIRDKNLNQYLIDIDEGKLLCSRSLDIDYIYLNHRIRNNFIEFRNGWINIPNDTGYFEIFNNHQIDEAYFGRGILFSEIFFEDDLLLIIAICPNKFKNTSNNIFTEEILYKHDNYSYPKRPQLDEPIRNEIVISLHSLKDGILLNTLFLQDCDVSAGQNFNVEISKLQKQLLIKSNENTFLINYKKGKIVDVLAGESVSFIDENYISHFHWCGYDSYFETDQLINTLANTIIEYKNLDFDLEGLNLYNYNGFVFFGCQYNNDDQYEKYRLFKIPLSDILNLKENHVSTVPIFSIKEKILKIVNGYIITYLFDAFSLKINKYDIQKLLFISPKNRLQSSINISQSDNDNLFEKFYYLDLHTLSSKKISDTKYLTERTEIGELLYQYKYCFDASKEITLVKKIIHFIKVNKLTFDIIIPIPPSNMNRPFQPVIELTKSISLSGYKVDINYLTKKYNTPPIKEINDDVIRKDILKDVFTIRDTRYKGKNILLFDDLYRSGETLNAATKVLKEKGEVANVYVLTITKTRTKK